MRAKDPDGNPVMMVVNPDSIAAVTALGASGGSQTAQGNTGYSGTHPEHAAGAEAPIGAPTSGTA